MLSKPHAPSLVSGKFGRGRRGTHDAGWNRIILPLPHTVVPDALQPEGATVICYRAHSRISKQRFLVQDFATIDT